LKLSQDGFAGNQKFPSMTENAYGIYRHTQSLGCEGNGVNPPKPQIIHNQGGFETTGE
jgi:hypothetical protein